MGRPTHKPWQQTGHSVSTCQPCTFVVKGHTSEACTQTKSTLTQHSQNHVLSGAVAASSSTCCVQDRLLSECLSSNSVCKSKGRAGTGCAQAPHHPLSATSPPARCYSAKQKVGCTAPSLSTLSWQLPERALQHHDMSIRHSSSKNSTGHLVSTHTHRYNPHTRHTAQDIRQAPSNTAARACLSRHTTTHPDQLPPNRVDRASMQAMWQGAAVCAHTLPSTPWPQVLLYAQTFIRTEDTTDRHASKALCGTDTPARTLHLLPHPACQPTTITGGCESTPLHLD